MDKLAGSFEFSTFRLRGNVSFESLLPARNHSRKDRTIEINIDFRGGRFMGWNRFGAVLFFRD